MYLFLALGIGLVLAWVVVSVMKASCAAWRSGERRQLCAGGQHESDQQPGLFLYRDVQRTGMWRKGLNSSGSSSTHLLQRDPRQRRFVLKGMFMNPYLSEKARGEIHVSSNGCGTRNPAFCVFCSVGGLYTLCLSLQDSGLFPSGYVFLDRGGRCAPRAVCRGEAAATMQEPSPAGWRATPGRKCLCGGCATALVWTQRTFA